MPKRLVNLDALIQREDFYVSSIVPDKAGGQVAGFGIDQLTQGQSLFGVLRKPDFQRETANWTAEQVVELVKNFLDEELIPAIILWKAPDKTIFVVDGAHRLSALIAWVNDDYGDRNISQKFFGHDGIPKAQLDAGKETRELMESSVGSYQSLRKFINQPEGASQIQLRRARNIASVVIQTQCVANDAAHAEASFYRINQGGAVIDDTETEIIHARRRPEALAARAMLRAGTGHEYWWGFDKTVKDEIKSNAQRIYNTLYKPEINDPIKTLELPVAGRGYAGDTLAVLYEFVHIANGLTRAKTQRKDKTFEPLPKDDPKRDTDGSLTCKYLKGVLRVAEVLASDEPKSLGLHPAVYAYSATGRFQPTAFFAQVKLVLDLELRKDFYKFTLVRKRFEDFLVEYKYFVNQLVGGYGSGTRGLDPLFQLYTTVLGEIANGKTDVQIKDVLLGDVRFSSLKEITPGEQTSGKNFSSDTKAAIRLKTALQSASRCTICGARLHPNATSIDHVERAADGGVGAMKNGEVTHPYCNTGFKEKRIFLGLAPKV